MSQSLQKQFEDIQGKIENEGLGYYVMDYTDSSAMPDETSRDLFDKASNALSDLVDYINEKADNE